MTRVLTVVGVAVAVVLVGVAAWFVFLREDPPDEFELTDTAETADGADGEAVAPVENGGIDGVWSVGANSQAGYRVVEDLGEVLNFEAVGRTDQVTGSVTISDSTVTVASFEVDVGSITSDDSRRDAQFHGPIMNVAEFPTATLTLTQPLVVSPAGVSQAMASGELTLRDATVPVQFPIDAQLANGQIEIVASIDVLFSDYGIANPSNPLVAVRDEGKVEVQLFLQRG